MIDTSILNAEIRAHARAQVEELNYDDIADALPEQLRAVATVPGLFVMIRRVSAVELSPGIKAQNVELEVSVGIVVASLAGANAALKGSQSLDAIAGKVQKALHWFQPPSTAQRRLKFRGEDEPVKDGSRFAVQQRYAITVHESYA